MRYIISFIILCLIFHSAFAEQQIKTPEEATEKALDYLGFLKMDGFNVEKNFDNASIVNISDDQTPFLHDKINNRDIWKVTYENITLSPYRGYPDSVEYPRTFDVYIDSDDGNLLKIESIYNGTNVDFAPEPSIEWAEKQIKDSQYIFLGFASPDSNYISFNELLYNVGPRNFKQLKALLIMNPGRIDKNPIPVWFITYRGIDPIYPISSGADTSDKMKFNYRSYIYDAKTGQSMGNTIQPRIKYDFE